MAISPCDLTNTALGGDQSRDGNVSPIHRANDGDALAVTLTLSSSQIAALGIPESVTSVRPVVVNGAILVEPADN